MSKSFAGALIVGAFALFATRTVLAQEPVTTPGTRDTTAQAAPVTPSTAEPATPAVTEPKAGAAESVDHRSEAVMHMEAAVDAGKKGDATAVTEHAEQALAQVQELQKQQPGEDLAKAVENLRDAITKGKTGDATGAMASAQDALTKLKTS